MPGQSATAAAGAETTLPLAALTALLTERYRPEGVRDRIVVPHLADPALNELVAGLVLGFTRRPGRHNRYMPVPGEHSVRTADFTDFLDWYGHEYQIAVVRVADVRTGALLDVPAIAAHARAEGVSCVWDWTGAVDWVDPSVLAAVGEDPVFWSTHTSLLDGTRHPAGVAGSSPLPVPPAPLAAPAERREAARRLADLLAGTGAVLAPHLGTPPPLPDDQLPLIVLDAGRRADEIVAAAARSAALTAAVCDGGRVTLVPDPAAADTALTALAADIRDLLSTKGA